MMTKSPLQEAIRLAKSGLSQEATVMLRELVVTNPNDMYAWLWLAECTTDVDEAREAANKVLEFRPTNQRALHILSGLGETPTASGLSLPFSSHTKQKVDAKPKDRKGMLIAGTFAIGVIAVIASLFIFGDPDKMYGNNNDDNSSESADMADNNSDRSERNSNNNSLDDIENLDPETLTIQWIQGVISGEQEADFSMSCGDGPSGLQRTLEPFMERILDYGITTILRTIQLDAVFTTLQVVDGTAEYEVDGKIIIEVFGQRIESPEFNTVVRFFSDGGQTLVCEVTGQ